MPPLRIRASIMFAKKSPAAIALCSSSSSSITASLTSSTSHPLYSSRRLQYQPTKCHSLYRVSPCAQTRYYATPSSFSSSPEPKNSEPSDDSPPVWPKSKRPTPYEIFAIKPKSPYTKKRFSQLVKLYHPDLVAQKSTAHLSQEIRLERYRLVVAANDLLSHPDKRHLYDVHGVGWAADDPKEALKNADRSWRHQPGTAARNATWEDWERWHQEREGTGKQEPLYMSNGVFATVVAGVALVGILFQTERAESTGADYVQIQSVQHHSVGQQMRMNTVATAGLSQNERVDRFLRDRENVEYSFNPAKYESKFDEHQEQHSRR